MGGAVLYRNRLMHMGCHNGSVAPMLNSILFCLLCKVSSSGFKSLIKTCQNRQTHNIQRLCDSYNPNVCFWFKD